MSKSQPVGKESTQPVDGNDQDVRKSHLELEFKRTGRDLRWSPTADQRLEETATYLVGRIAKQAEIIAEFSDSEEVSKRHVERAESVLSLIRPNPLLSAGISISLLVLGGFIGTLIQVMVSDQVVSRSQMLFLIVGVCLSSTIAAACAVAEFKRRNG